MSTLRIFAGVVGVVCFGVLLAACSSGGTSISSTSSGASSLSPEEDILRAAGAGDIPRLQALLAQDKTLVDAYGPNGMSPLQAAAAAGQNAAVSLLLENGADPMMADDDGNNPLNAAKAEGHPDTAKIITDAIAAKGGAAPQAQ